VRRASKLLVAAFVAFATAVTIGTGPASATTARTQPNATVAATSDSYLLAAGLVARAGRYVHIGADGRATLARAAGVTLSRSERANVAVTIDRYNSAASKAGTRSGSAAISVTPRVASAAKVRGPTCGWSVSWHFYWYGWTIKFDGCLVDWLAYAAAAIAGVSALVAAIQAFLDVPFDVATILAGIAAAGGGVMALHLKTCQQLGYHGGVTYNDRFGILYPGCY
jgi:hypothetical protein